MTVSVLIPFDAAGDEHRRSAYNYVVDRITGLHPDWEIVAGAGAFVDWSKGAAVAELTRQSSGDILILHDADSYTDADTLDEAVDLLRSGAAPWVVPHGLVYRLRLEETQRVYAGGRARRGHVVRTPYTGPAGGGIVVLTRGAYDTVHGIDPRFVGWGGEDIALGMALDTLIGPHRRIPNPLIHLWHPHPAPDLRGSPASEELVAAYRMANGLRRRMTALVERRADVDPTPLEQPIIFRSRRPSIRLAARTVRFPGGSAAVDDPDIVDALRAHPQAAEAHQR